MSVVKDLFNNLDYAEYCRQLEDCTSEELALMAQAIEEARLQKQAEEEFAESFEDDFDETDFEDEDDFDDYAPYEDFYDDEIGYNPYEGCYDADL